MNHVLSIALVAMALVAIPPSTVTGHAREDWPQWRGDERDGISEETGLLQEWPPGGPPLVFQAGGLGEGYSSMSLADGRLYTMGSKEGREYVLALDAQTGEKVWETAHGRHYRNNRGDGPRGTPTVDGDRLYALGGNGDLSCLERATGRILWSLNLLETFHARNISWGLSESPLVWRDRVVAQAGGRGASVVALDKMNGKVLWTSQSDEAGYSSAVLMEVGDVPQAVFFTGERAFGLDLRDGRLLWDYRRVSNRTANIATPVVRGNRVFLSSDYGTGGALLEIREGPTGVNAREVYFTREMRNHHSSSVLVGDYLYGFSGSILTALHFETGDVAWKDRSVGKGSLIYADGNLYLFSERGVVGLAEATPEGYREKGRFEIPRPSAHTWSHPVVSEGRLYIRDQDALYCYDLRPAG